MPESFDEHVKLHFDLQPAGVQGRYHARFDGSVRPRPDRPPLSGEQGQQRGFHGASHHAENPRNIETYSHINQYHVKCLAYFVDKLSNTKEGDGTLLDHSLILYGTNMGDSNQHLHYDVPHILVGGASGQLKGDRHLHYETKTITTRESIAEHLGHVRDSSGLDRR